MVSKAEVLDLIMEGLSGLRIGDLEDDIIHRHTLLKAKQSLGVYIKEVRMTEDSNLVPTLGVDKDRILYINKDFWDKLEYRHNQIIVLLHELMHIVNGDVDRLGKEVSIWEDDDKNIRDQVLAILLDARINSYLCNIAGIKPAVLGSLGYPSKAIVADWFEEDKVSDRVVFFKMYKETKGLCLERLLRPFSKFHLYDNAKELAKSIVQYVKEEIELDDLIQCLDNLLLDFLIQVIYESIWTYSLSIIKGGTRDIYRIKGESDNRSIFADVSVVVGEDSACCGLKAGARTAVNGNSAYLAGMTRLPYRKLGDALLNEAAINKSGSIHEVAREILSSTRKPLLSLSEDLASKLRAIDLPIFSKGRLPEDRSLLSSMEDFSIRNMPSGYAPCKIWMISNSVKNMGHVTLLNKYVRTYSLAANLPQLLIMALMIIARDRGEDSEEMSRLMLWMEHISTVGGESRLDIQTATSTSFSPPSLYDIYRAIYDIIQENSITIPISLAIGSHGEGMGSGESGSGIKDKELEDQLKRAIGQVLRNSLDGTRVATAGGPPVDIDDTGTGDRRKIDISRLQELRVIDAKNKFYGIIGFSDKSYSRSPLPITPSPRDLLKASMDLPVFLWRKKKPIIGNDVMGVEIYMDVSGSMNEEIPKLVDMIKSNPFIEEVHFFSTIIHTVKIEDYLSKKVSIKSTGGTSFDAVAKHIIDNKVESALIVSDCAGSTSKSMDKNISKVLKKFLTVIVAKRDKTDSYLQYYRNNNYFLREGEPVYLEDVVA